AGRAGRTASAGGRARGASPVDRRISRGSELDAEERAQLREDVEQAYDYWSPQAREITEQLDELCHEATDPAAADDLAESEEVAEPQPQ
ncbi:MAG TPA: hypothetical protein VI122_00790, partial [Thermoleophilaceae bacterium]